MPAFPQDNPLNDPVARDRKAEDVFRNECPSLVNPVLLLGNDPFDAEEFAEFLRRWKIKTYILRFRDDLFDPQDEEDWKNFVGVGFHPPIVVLGRKKWLSMGLISLLADDRVRKRPVNPQIFHEMAPCWIEKDTVDGEMVFWRSHDCRRLTFCSQEEFLAGFFARKEITQNLLLAAGGSSHEALARVEQIRETLRQSGEYFPWPSTVALSGNGQVSGDEWPQIGVLSYMGYHVGVAGIPKSVRGKKLGALFQCQKLPNIGGSDYIAEWGCAESAKRLKKMAYSIAAFCRMAKRRQRDLMARAVENWEDDLAWLKQRYYDGRFDGSFVWPPTDK